MSFAVFQQLTPSQVVEASIFASLTTATSTELVLAKSDRLELWELQRKQQQLSLRATIPLCGRPEAIAAFRAAPNEPHRLTIVFRRARYLSVLQFDPELNSTRTCGQQLLLAADDPASVSAPVGFKPQISVDPSHRCLVVRVLPDRCLVFPILGAAGAATFGYGSTSTDGSKTLPLPGAALPSISSVAGSLSSFEGSSVPSGLGTPFTLGNSAPLRLHHIQGVEFLHGYRQPTAVCLGQTRPPYGGCLNESNQCTSSVMVFTLDLVEKAPNLIWATHKLPHDLHQIVPLPEPVGGMIGVCNNSVIYMKEHGKCFLQTLNPCAALGHELEKLKGIDIKDETALSIQLTGCSVVALSPTTLLFSVQPAGRLYFAHLVLESRDVVADIVWISPGMAPPCSSLAAASEDYVFLAAKASEGSSSLMKLTPSRKTLPAKLQKMRPTKRRRTNEAGDSDSEKEVEAQSCSEKLADLLQEHRSLREAGRHIPSFNVSIADSLAAFGAMPCLAPWRKDVDDGEDDEDEDEEGDEKEKKKDQAAQKSAANELTERVLCASGSGSNGTLYVAQRSVPLDLLTEFDLPGNQSFGAVWTLERPAEEPLLQEAEPLADKTADPMATLRAALAASQSASKVVSDHRFVVMGGESATMVLETTEEIEETTKHISFDSKSKTLTAGTVLGGRLAVQVTPRQVRFMRAFRSRGSDFPPALDLKAHFGLSSPASSASVLEPFVAISFEDGSLRLLAITDESDKPYIELSSKLAQDWASDVLTVSLFRTPSGGVYLVTLQAAAQGTMRLVDLKTMTEIFLAKHVLDFPPIIRNHLRCEGAHLDHLRSLTDLGAALPKATVERAKKEEEGWKDEEEKLDSKTGASTRSELSIETVALELFNVDGDDVGPTLALLRVGRPLILYRSFLAPAPTKGHEEDHVLPFYFSIVEHDFGNLIEHQPPGSYRAVAEMRNPNGTPAGAVVLPPHAGIPGLWLAAKRNQLYIHPLSGTKVVGFSQLRAACCGGTMGYFALCAQDGSTSIAAQVQTPSQVASLAPEGTSQGAVAFDLQWPIPVARHSLKRTPHLMASRPGDSLVAIAVSETVLESPPGPGDEDNDPLAEDWSIVRKPPVEYSPPPMPRAQPRFELWIDDAKNLSKLGRYRFTFDLNEHVLCMQWLTLPGFPSPSLVVGTGVNTGEDLTCRGRILIFSTHDHDPGILPAIYQRALKWPVTVVGQWGNYFIHSEGSKLYFERWENNAFAKLAFFDASMCVTAMSSIKSFLLLGDLRRGLDFVQWKEDKESNTRNLRRLSRSPPTGFLTVLACDFLVCGKSLGLVALDHNGTANLYQYTPHSDGREGDQLLRSCATFFMGYPCRAVARLNAGAGQQSLLMASGGGELLCLKPINDQVYRTVATLAGMLSTRLPYRAGLNPRGMRIPDGAPALVAPRKNIEDGSNLRTFTFLSAPLQAQLAEKMRLPEEAIMKVIAQTMSTSLA